MVWLRGTVLIVDMWERAVRGIWKNAEREEVID